MNTSNKILSRIKDENIKPIPRWRHTSRNVLLWIAFLLSVLLGAVAFSIILFSIQQIEFNLIAHMTHSRFEMWLSLLPFLWIISLIVFLFVSIFGLKKTKKGYKFSITRIVIGSAVLSILFGAGFFIGGGAKWLENRFAMNLEFYEGINEKKVKMWTLPEEGYLSGVIVSIGDSTLQMQDFESNIWTIDITEAKIFTIVKLEKDEKIKLIGQKVSALYFMAEEVRPWGGYGQNGKGRGRPGR